MLGAEFGSTRVRLPAHPPRTRLPARNAGAPARSRGRCRSSPGSPVRSSPSLWQRLTASLNTRPARNLCSDTPVPLLLLLSQKRRYAFESVTWIRTQREKDYMGKELPREYLGSTDKFSEQTSINTGKTHFSYHWNSFSSFVKTKAFAARNKEFSLPASHSQYCSTREGFLIYMTTTPRLKPLSAWKRRRSNLSSANCSELGSIPVFNLQPTIFLPSLLERFLLLVSWLYNLLVPVFI